MINTWNGWRNNNIVLPRYTVAIITDAPYAMCFAIGNGVSVFRALPIFGMFDIL